jgi:hypothetical protein
MKAVRRRKLETWREMEKRLAQEWLKVREARRAGEQKVASELTVVATTGRRGGERT